MSEATGRSRRDIIKRSALAGAALWVAPRVVDMGVAGAATTGCYVLRFETNPLFCTPYANPSASGCASFPATPVTTGTVSAACTSGASLVSFVFNNGTLPASNQVTATVSAGCQLLFLGGANNGGLGCKYVTGTGQELSLQLDPDPNWHVFFFIVVGFCCNGGSA